MGHNSTDKEILSRVLQNLMMAQLAGKTSGDDQSVGPRCESELQVIRRFQQERGYTYPEIEEMFWSADFVQSYMSLSISQKTAFLNGLSKAAVSQYAGGRKRNRPREGDDDGIVYYLTTVAFGMLGVDPSSLTSARSQGSPASGERESGPGCLVCVLATALGTIAGTVFGLLERDVW